MKKSKFTEQQIVFALKQAETGVAVAEVCRKMGISEATFYNWKKKFSGLGTAASNPHESRNPAPSSAAKKMTALVSGATSIPAKRTISPGRVAAIAKAT
ncbi:MAG TPA: transposase [Pyrinomonadaceae bacterium]|nr:transposase [Pyrinomonadaceae bacterium]